MAFTDEDGRRAEAEQQEQMRRLLQQGRAVITGARGCRSGCGCLSTFISLAIVLFIGAAIVFLFTGRGDSAGKRACERFYELDASTNGLALSEVWLSSELNDIRELAVEAKPRIRDTSDALFTVAHPLEVDKVTIIAATAAMGAACAEAGHSP